MYVFQKDRINPAAWNQSELWYDADGMPHLIKDLPYTYAKNILRKIYKMGKYHDKPLTKAIKQRVSDARSELQ